VAVDANGVEPGVYDLAAVYTDSAGQTTSAPLRLVIQAPPRVVTDGVERPVATGGTVVFDESVTTTGVITGRDVTRQPDGGVAELTPAVTYRAGDAPPGRHEFAVTSTDDVGQSVTATYAAVVLAPPATKTVEVELATDQDSAVVDPVSDAAAPGVGDLGLGAVTPPAHGAVSGEGLDGGRLRYRPEVGKTGSFEWTATVCDEVGQCGVITYLVHVRELKDDDQDDGDDHSDKGGDTGEGGGPGGEAGDGAGQSPAAGDSGDGLPRTGPALGAGGYIWLMALAAALAAAGWAGVARRRAVRARRR
ncbi:MAG: hypothetical protein LBO20_06680, partial [Bifidobacteriaceae bacterium]|jgi:hypothetical protein|nr:hypothetical protein [Bifidobacteriaceae bacterium]